MPRNRIELYYTPGQRILTLSELCGTDEMALDHADTENAIRLLDRLITAEVAKGTEALSAGRITTADRDRVLAHLYVMVYGPKVESTVHCQFCEARFDLDFSLPDLQQHLQPGQGEVEVEQMEDGSFKLTTGHQFRLPTGEDELAVATYPPEQAAELLLRRCLLEGDPASAGEQVQEAMAQIAPVLQTETQAFCPECGKEQALFFDVQSFFLGRLLKDQTQVIREVHRLASVYHWSSTEILSLPRRLRRMYFDHIEYERS